MIARKCSYATLLDNNPEHRAEIGKAIKKLTLHQLEVFIRGLEVEGTTNRKTISNHIEGKCLCNREINRFVESRKHNNSKRELRIAVVDIETMKGRFRWEDWRGKGITIEGDYWRLGDYKDTIGYIPHSAIVYPSRNICASWGWVGEEKIHFAAEWQGKSFTKTMRGVLDEADVVIFHNAPFDKKRLNTQIITDGLTPPSDYRVIDTLAVLRSQFAFDSNALDAACRLMNLPGKTDKLEMDYMYAAVNGDKAAQERIEEYNKGDIIATMELYLKLLPWIKNHPNVASLRGVDEIVCQRCGSDNVKREGFYSPSVLVYRKYRCNDCGGQFRDTHQARGASAKNI